MTETRLLRRGGKSVKVEGYTCTECGVWGPYDEFHPWLFCLLHKQGWTRKQIVDHVRWLVEELG